MTTTPTSTARTPRAARSTKQERSRETLERILAAAEDLLETREFDELTMVDLAKRAGCGVGTVYGRVPDKESLLHCLHERYMSAGMTDAAAVFEGVGDGDLEARVHAMSGLVVDFYSRRRGVTRAITNYLWGRASGDVTPEFRAFRRQATEMFRQASAFLAEKVDARLHPDPQAACEFALQAVTDVAQSRLVFGQRSGVQINYSKRALKDRINGLMLAYLRHGSP